MLKLMFMVIEALSMIQIFWMLRFVTHLWAGVGVHDGRELFKTLISLFCLWDSIIIPSFKDEVKEMSYSSDQVAAVAGLLAG